MEPINIVLIVLALIVAGYLGWAYKEKKAPFNK